MTMFEADVFFDKAPKESGWIVTNDLLGEEKAKMCVGSVLQVIYGRRPFEITVEFNADDQRWNWHAEAENRLHVRAAPGHPLQPPPSMN